MQAEQLSTQEVADLAGVHKDTLLRWLRDGAVSEPARDGRGWRSFSVAEAGAITRFAKERACADVAASTEAADLTIEKLNGLDWDFHAAKTNYLTHGLHPYPAKFIPQIPNALIQELSSVGDTIADIFCGSGTTLLEALQLKRNAVGVDANPLAALISKAKTTTLSNRQIEMALRHRDECLHISRTIRPREGNLFYDGKPFLSAAWRPDADMCEFWFEPHVVEELAEIRLRMSLISDEKLRIFCSALLSAIIVAVSKQDSDTRYVRRDKQIQPGDTIRRYISQLDSAIPAAVELSDIVEDRFSCRIYNESLLDAPKIGPCDLVVCSPPYPNAYSYHLYHRTRMLWLGYDPEKFKKEEIGSHRKYSAKGSNRATAETFKREFRFIFTWLRTYLKDRKYACFVIGDSTINGERIDNAALLAEAASQVGFQECARISRELQATKKSFNPKIGKIRKENILILQKAR
ncbi:helix-turn-helix domain-containing protein [Methylobacterium sp. R2-1]|uniref:helix-turn-helix domain-containing protein n=1 Tax=Methylobacterium sp. R2-1 TaxID=2587064 RepID=UPI00161B7370|nr:helix-turn-helix domain-containing protein [Methylobacterium sp. R2-1]MBB2961819.1 site-specific DNA-methyltransferase (cytosine-N4-specific) [Methylobacterium sp. R2-1]